MFITNQNAYQQCQRLFEQTYPHFQDAGHYYRQVVAALTHPRTRLLDLGCGRDSLAGQAMRQAQWSVGIDLDLEALPDNRVVKQAVAGTGDHVPLADHSLDLITAQWVVEHLQQPAAVFQELERLLRPGGHLVLFTTNAHNYIPLLSHCLPDRLRHWLLTHLLQRPAGESFPTFFRANTLPRLTALAEASGLTLTDYAYIGNPFYLAFSPLLFRAALWFEQMTDRLGWERLKLYVVVTFRKRLSVDLNGKVRRRSTTSDRRVQTGSEHLSAIY